MPPRPPRPNTVTVQDAAAVLGVSRQRVGQLIGSGTLQAIRWPRHVVVLRTSLDALAKERGAGR